MSNRDHALQKIRNKLRLRQRTRGFIRAALRRTGFLNQRWADGVPKEIEFWENALRAPASHWIKSEYQKRLDPHLELQEDLKRLVDSAPGNTVRIIDVGAGPLTHLGKKWDGRVLELFPVDPLANEYKEILTRLKICPPVITEMGDGENLLGQFQANFFDLACAFNSLDHCKNPLLAVRNMLAIVKPNCFVHIQHFRNEGLEAGYAGLHQWNFDVKEGDMILDNGINVHYSLKAEFKNKALVECEFQEMFGRKTAVGRIKKLP